MIEIDSLWEEVRNHKNLTAKSITVRIKALAISAWSFGRSLCSSLPSAELPEMALSVIPKLSPQNKVIVSISERNKHYITILSHHGKVDEG